MNEVLLSGIFGKPRAFPSGIEDSDMTALFFGYLASRARSEDRVAKVPAFADGDVTINGVTLRFDTGWRGDQNDVDATIQLIGLNKQNRVILERALEDDLISFQKSLSEFLFECAKDQTVGGEQGQKFVARDVSPYSFYGSTALIPVNDPWAMKL